MRRPRARVSLRINILRLTGRAVLAWAGAIGLAFAGALATLPGVDVATPARAAHPIGNPYAPLLDYGVNTTDTFDNASDNGSINTPTNFVGGLIDCSIAPSEGTFYRASSLTGDQDWYKFSGVQTTYTVTVAWSDPITLPISLQLRKPNASTFFVNRTAASHTVSFYADVAGDYLLGLFSVNSFTDTGRYPYTLKICSGPVEITPTPSSTPTQTPTPTATAAVAPAEADAYDKPGKPGLDNDTPTEAFDSQRFVNVGSTISSLNFYNTAPGSPGLIQAQQRGVDADVDWFIFYGRRDSTYRLTTAVQPGVDTELFVFTPEIKDAVAQTFNVVNNSTVGLVSRNDDYKSLDRGSQVSFKADRDGVFYVKVWNLDQTPRGSGQTYTLQLEEILAATATATTAAAAYPGGADSCEYNGSFETACLLTMGAEYAANFIPLNPDNDFAQDNDFYRIPVKQGLNVTCETSKLEGGTDTNIIIYNKDRVGVGGNDDISVQEKEKGNFASRFSFFASYTGEYFVLAGEVNPPKVREAPPRKYAIRCFYGLPPTQTPTITFTPPPVTPNTPTATPGATRATSGQPAPGSAAQPPPPVSTAAAVPVSQPASGLKIVPVARPTSVAPTAPPTPVGRVTEIVLRAFVDNNANGLYDVGEGVAGASVWVVDERDGTPLAQAETGIDGSVRLSVSGANPMRVKVPLFDYASLVNGTRADLQLMLSGAPQWPSVLP